MSTISKAGLFPARCNGCRKLSESRVLGTVPPGWLKIRDPRDGSHVYLCPDCKGEQR